MQIITVNGINITPKYGDMPGDKVQISKDHISKAGKIYDRLLPILRDAFNQNPNERAVIAVCGGSGVGKSEIASLLAGCLAEDDIEAYTLSGDNYPHRIPQHNDAERLRVFQSTGLCGLVASGVYTDEIAHKLRILQSQELDCAPESIVDNKWLDIYQLEGRKGLKGYLGTTHEQDYQKLSDIISQFKNGASDVWLKRMGRTIDNIYYEKICLENTKVLIIEWTHGNSDNFVGVDIPILLNSTPEETRAHRRERNRDGKIDSAFTTVVLELEQQIIESQAHKAKLIISKNGEMLTYEQYRKAML